jgi:hypothetical protein
VHYPSAIIHRKYILVNLTEQWMGAYEFGELKFSMPAATGVDKHPTPKALIPQALNAQASKSALKFISHFGILQ